MVATRRRRHERSVRRRAIEAQLQSKQQEVQQHAEEAKQASNNGKATTTLALYGDDVDIKDVVNATNTILSRGCKPLCKLSLLHIYFLLQHPLHGLTHERVFRDMGSRMTVPELRGLIRALLCEPRVVRALLRAKCPPADTEAGVRASSVKVEPC